MMDRKIAQLELKLTEYWEIYYGIDYTSVP